MKSMTEILKPELGIGTDAKVIRVVDGDTVEVEITRRFHVRMNNVKKPELKTPEGKKAKAELEAKIPPNTTVRLFIPTNDPLKLMDVNSFERIVADIWLNDEKLS
jgi:endonuclease YncB( thermonuclease family)